MACRKRFSVMLRTKRFSAASLTAFTWRECGRSPQRCWHFTKLVQFAFLFFCAARTRVRCSVYAVFWNCCLLKRRGVSYYYRASSRSWLGRRFSATVCQPYRGTNDVVPCTNIEWKGHYDRFGTRGSRGRTDYLRYH